MMKKMMVVDLVVKVEGVGHTFDKLEDTLMEVEDMKMLDYKIHYTDYLSMMMMMMMEVVEEDEMVLLFHLNETFDVFVVNAYHYHSLMMNRDFEMIHPENFHFEIKSYKRKKEFTCEGRELSGRARL